MVLTTRTKLSLTQLISLFDQDVVRVLFGKYNISYELFNNQIKICDALLAADNTQIETLMQEVIATMGDLKKRVSPKLRFDERWKDLTKCLLLDGYKIDQRADQRVITKAEPFSEGIEPIEDDLSKELTNSNLSKSNEIQTQIDGSANDFRKTTPDFNSCLTHSRIALETLVRKIAEHLGFKADNGGKAWGSSLAYLQANNFITKKEEEALSSVYTFISDGSHVPLGFTEEEYARFGRNLSTSMCYFMIKLFNGKKST